MEKHCPARILQDMHADTHTYTHTQSSRDTLAEVGDMEDVRPVSGFRGWDGQGIVIGDMEEIGYVSGIMRVEGLAETTEIAVESQSSTWGFLMDGSHDSSGECFFWWM